MTTGVGVEAPDEDGAGPGQATGPSPGGAARDQDGGGVPLAEALDAVLDAVVHGVDRRSLRARDVAREAGVSLLSARRFWRALGFPAVDEDHEAFTREDVEALARVSALVRRGVVDDSVALGLTRAFGRSVDRLASWQVQLLGEVVAEQRARDGVGPARLPLGDEVAALVTALGPDLEPLVVYAWRRHLASAVQRFAAEQPLDPAVPTVRRVVGFADLVSFTRLVRRLSERELAVLVQRFEVLTSDVVSTHGGRIIKTVGDEVLFVAWPPAAAAAIGLDISEELSGDPLMPDVRVGLALGEVVARLGDVFGTTVNRASRLTSMAYPGSVLVDDATAAALDGSTAFACTRTRRRTAKGLGSVSPWRLTRRRDRGAAEVQRYAADPYGAGP